MEIRFRCDGCGLEEVKDSISAPSGWLEPPGLTQRHGPHLCRNCTIKALNAEPESGVVPIHEQRRVGG